MAFICKLKAQNQIKREERGEKEVNDMVKRQQNDELTTLTVSSST